jgi:hypothetical protein
MNLQSYNQDDESIVAQPGADEQAPPAELGPETTILSESASRAQQAHDDRNDAENTSPTSGQSKASKPRKRTGRAQPLDNGDQAARQHKRSGGRGLRSGSSAPEGIITLSRRQNAEAGEKKTSKTSAPTEATLSELEAQGFTEDEAYNLIHVSDRIANSRETREAEAIIRRLRFNRWLFEQGKLSEFSA